MTLRIAVVADIHHGPRSLTKRGEAALDLTERFVEFAEREAVDLVLDLGDRISDKDRETDRENMTEVAKLFEGLGRPLYHVCGNHDLDHLTRDENAEILGQPLQSTTIDLGGWRIAIWQADAKIARSVGTPTFHLLETDFLWLAEVAEASDRPLLVVSHVPVSGHAQTGNYYFERNAALSTYPQAPRVRQALSRCRHPVVCLSGHVHWNTVTQVDGIVHLTQQSLTESFTTRGEPAGSFGLLELNDDVAFSVEGRDPFHVRLRPGAGRWMPPLAPFA